MPEELAEASEVFLCGTAAEIVPVGSIDGHHYQVRPGRPHPDGGLPEAGARARLRGLRRDRPIWCRRPRLWRLDSRALSTFFDDVRGVSGLRKGSGLRQPMGLNPLNLIRVMPAKEREFIDWPSPSVIVVGAGVAGLRCALELAERGVGRRGRRARPRAGRRQLLVDGGRHAGAVVRARHRPTRVVAWARRRSPGGLSASRHGAKRQPGRGPVARRADLDAVCRAAPSASNGPMRAHRRARARSRRPLPPRAVLSRRGPSRSAAGPGGTGRAPRSAAASPIRFGVEPAPSSADADIVVDCRGLGAARCAARPARRARRDGRRALARRVAGAAGAHAASAHAALHRAARRRRCS